MKHAACKGGTKTMFAHECSHRCRTRDGCIDSDGSLTAARDICRGCPVLTECRTWAIMTPEQEGVLGMLTEQERRTIRAALHMNTDRRRSDHGHQQ